jgi:hypothetical protein
MPNFPFNGKKRGTFRVPWLFVVLNESIVPCRSGCVKVSCGQLLESFRPKLVPSAIPLAKNMQGHYVTQKLRATILQERSLDLRWTRNTFQIAHIVLLERSFDGSSFQERL